MKKPCGHILMDAFCFESVLHGEICGNFTWVQSFKFSICTIAFQSVLHDNSNTWVGAGPLKVKYLVKVGKFKRNLKRDPLSQTPSNHKYYSPNLKES